MNRTEWEFPYSAKALNEAATRKSLHHKERETWWQIKKDQTIATIRSEGIEVDESLAAAEFSKLSNYNRVPTVQIREDLKRDLEECVQKVKEHHNKVEGYESWMQVLASQGETMFPLHQDDWLYFFGQ